MPTHCQDDTMSSRVISGGYIFLAHHGGVQAVNDIVHQTRAALESMAHTLSTVGATLDDLVQVDLYIKNAAGLRRGRDVFKEYFKHGAPARMTVVTKFVGSNCLCQMDGIAYKPAAK